MSSSNLPLTLSFHGNGGAYPPHGIATVNNHGPYVVVANWIMMCLMVLAVAARVGSRWNLGKDNVVIFAAAMLSITQSITIHLAANHGLGQHISSLSNAEFAAYSKSFYASQIIQISVLCLAKLSLILIYMSLSRSRQMQRLLRLFTGFVALWDVAATIALAAQCQAPDPWNFTPSRCCNQGALYYVNGVINIVTDVVIVVLPYVLVWKVQIGMKARIGIIGIFTPRILVCVTAIGELVSLRNYLQSSDPTWENVIPSIWSQVMMNLSIITACLPIMKPFLTKLQFSLIDSSMPFYAGFYHMHLLSRKDQEAYPNAAGKSSNEDHNGLWEVHGSKSERPLSL